MKGFPGADQGGFLVSSPEGSETKFDKTSTKVRHAKVRHVEVGFLSVKEAASKLGKNPRTIERWCESGKLAATPKPYGKKMTWLISPQAVELVLMMEAAKAEDVLSAQKELIESRPHADYKKAWVNAMAKGFINGRPFSKCTIEDYEYYVDLYLAVHPTVSLDGLKQELSRIPIVHISKRQHYYKAIVCLGKFLVKEKVLSESFLNDAKALFPKRHLPAKRSTVDETGIHSLYTACKRAQDRLIILLLAHTGLRASEACALTWGDIDLSGGQLTVQLGKGNKTRKVGISSRLMDALKEQMSEVPTANHNPVLVNTKGKAMNRSGLFQRVERLGLSAGVSVSPHALRRAFVTINANKGRPLVILQRSCGHSDIKTTMSYCLTAEQEVIEAMKGWD